MANCRNCRARDRAGVLCNQTIDYEQVEGQRILPFTIRLNEEDSVLAPTAGENQRFCYDIIATGANTSAYADLSHLVFGICDEITTADLAAVRVVRNGVTETVVLGDNVEIRTPEFPDPPTGCPGIKFDFGLDKVDGVMQVCFEMQRAYPIQPIPVCLYGGGVTASGLSICGPVCRAEASCPATGYQTMNICVPVTITPTVRVGNIRTVCCGDASVSSGERVCPGTPNGSCTFTISQRLCMAIPVVFGATAQVGEHSVECLGASEENLCASCQDDE